MKIKVAFLLFIMLSCLQMTAQIQSEKLDELDAYFSQAMEAWDVPGLAIALVSKDTVLFAKGYGVRDIQNKQAVDAHTLFAVASNTKAFTAAAVMMLVEEGKLSLDDKVVSHLPFFALYDPYVSQAMTVRDLLTHRSGLKTFSGDLIWYGSTYSREEIIRKAKYLKPAYGFREQFGYSNIMYIAAGEVVAAASNRSWDEFIKERLLAPLHMQRSTLHVSELPSLDNVAQPHTYVQGKLQQIPWLDWDNMGPAGSLISSASEMANWLQLNLNDGTFQDNELLKPSSIFQMQAGVTPLPVSKSFTERFPSTHFRTYGLGWSMMDYLGRKIVSHNGGYDGMISQTVLIPEEGIGFVILTNALSNLYYPLMYKTLDVLLENAVQKDWSTEILSQIKSGEERQQQAREKILAERVENTQPSLQTDGYTGFYGSPIYDSIQVTAANNGDMQLAFMRSPDFVGSLKHWHYNTFELEFKLLPSLPKGFVSFNLDRNGRVASMEIFVDNPDFDFTELELKKL